MFIIHSIVCTRIGMQVACLVLCTSELLEHKAPAMNMLQICTCIFIDVHSRCFVLQGLLNMHVQHERLPYSCSWNLC